MTSSLAAFALLIVVSLIFMPKPQAAKALARARR